MNLIYEVAKKLDGRIDGDKAVAAAKGMTIQSPRGPILIDPETRDVVQDVYVRKVQKVGGKCFNVEFDKLAKVKDPGKS
jgi:branched-chain amino acid transport system substrate-binding protein